MQIIHKIKLDLASTTDLQRIKVMQNDSNTRVIEATLLCNGQPWPVPENVSVGVAFRKKDDTFGLYDTMPNGAEAITLNKNRTIVTAVLVPQVMTCPGPVNASVALVERATLDRISTFPFTIMVEEDPSAGKKVSNDYYAYSTLKDVNSAIATVNNKISKEVAGLLIRNLFTMGELVEGYYFNLDEGTGKPTANVNYNFYKVRLIPGEYTVYPRAKFITNITAGTQTGGTTTPATFTVAEESLYYITMYAADLDPKLYASGTDISIVEAVGRKILDPSVQIPDPFVVSNLFTNGEYVEGYYYNHDNGRPDGQASSSYNFYKVWLTPGEYTVYPRARFISNITAGTQTGETKTPAAFTVEDTSLYYITVFAEDAPKLYTSEKNPEDVEPVGMKKLPANVLVEIPTGGLLRNVTLYNFGDSIGAGDGNGGTGYAELLGSKHGATVTDFAVGGSTLSRVAGQSMQSILDHIDSAPAAVPDIVLLEGGANDYSQYREMGNVTGETVFDLAQFDETTYIGALETALYKLHQRYPGSVIIWIYTHRENTRTQKTNGTVTVNFTTMHDLSLEVCKKWAIPVVDLYNEGGLNTQWEAYRNAYTYNADGTHPNAAGYERFYLPLILAKIKALLSL